MSLELNSEYNNPELAHHKKRLLILLFGFIFIVLALPVLIFTFAVAPPKEFPENSTIMIDRGMSVVDIVERFEQRHYVHSSNLLLIYLRFFYETENIKAGVYHFSEPVSLQEVAHTIAKIGPNDPLISVTFPEGSTVHDFAQIAQISLSEFETDEFLTYAAKYEGYLFPETYFVPDVFTDKQLFELLRETFETEIASLSEEIEQHPLNLNDIITLASIIEREANTPQSMKMVSGILQNRLKIGMPLQADASIEYVLDTPLNELPEGQLASALREIDSPYNTYLNTGLPPTPIGNPGMAAITAVLDPTLSDYFYYITDSDNIFHYAKTLSEHNRNIDRYLR